jgi:hypothetical protein
MSSLFIVTATGAVARDREMSSLFIVTATGAVARRERERRRGGVSTYNIICARWSKKGKRTERGCHNIHHIIPRCREEGWKQYNIHALEQGAAETVAAAAAVAVRSGGPRPRIISAAAAPAAAAAAAASLAAETVAAAAVAIRWSEAA